MIPVRPSFFSYYVRRRDVSLLTSDLKVVIAQLLLVVASDSVVHDLSSPSGLDPSLHIFLHSITSRDNVLHSLQDTF